MAHIYRNPHKPNGLWGFCYALKNRFCFLHMIKFEVPNNCKDGSNEKEEKSCYKNTAIFLFFRLFELALAVIGISLLLRSAHGDKGQHGVSDYESDAYECAFAADIEHTRKKRHQYTRNEEGIR